MQGYVGRSGSYNTSMDMEVAKSVLQALAIWYLPAYGC